MLEQELQKIGLSDKEARVYLSSLQLGKSPVQEIAQQSGVNRGTAYNIIESLMKKGLMSSFEQGKKTFFTAESPERLSSLIKIQEEELKLKEKEFSKYLPELRSMYGSADNKPKVKYYEGTEGLKALQDEYLKVKSKRIDNIVYFDSVFSVLPGLLQDYTPRRIQRKISSRFMYISKKGPDERFLPVDKDKLRESKFIPYEKFPFHADITIFDNKVSLESYSDKSKILGVLIEDKEIADSMRTMFKYIWNSVDN
jgi:HTH-type transcriptional regulator, sugar sensing transcriptional regulator